MPVRSECFVYVQLPGALEPVVCGRFERERTRTGGFVGRFVYGRSYRERPDAVPLDPIHLPLAPTVYRTAKLEGVFGALRDASPDANVDDHPRNHALVAPGRDWHLAPAYDLTPNARQGSEGRRLAMECGVLGRVATRENLVSQAPRFGLRAEEANAVIAEMQNIVGRFWRAEVLRNGGSEHDCKVIEGAFVYPGFEYLSEP